MHGSGKVFWESTMFDRMDMTDVHSNDIKKKSCWRDIRPNLVNRVPS